MLLEKGWDVATKDDYGATALHRAAANGYKAAVRLLLEKSADVDAKDHRRRTALQ